MPPMKISCSIVFLLLFCCREGGQVLLWCVRGWHKTQLRPEVSQLVLAAAQLLVAGCMGLDVYKGLSLWPETSYNWSSLEVWHERVHLQQRRTHVLLRETTLLDFYTGWEFSVYLPPSLSLPFTFLPSPSLPPHFAPPSSHSVSPTFLIS